MVRMWPLMRELMSSIIAARVVDFPDPVLPVTRISPLMIRAEVAHRLRHVELVERQRLRGNGAKHGAHAAQVTHDVDPKARARPAGDRRSPCRPWPRSARLLRRGMISYSASLDEIGRELVLP